MLALLLVVPAPARGDESRAVPAFTVGAILPLTGALAEYGVAWKNGVEAAAEDRPDTVRRIRFVYEDSHYDATAAVSAFSKLTQEGTIDLVFVWGNPTWEAVAPLAEEQRVPMLAVVMNPSVSRNRRYIIRASDHAEMFSRRLAGYLRSRGWSRLGVVLTENSYLRGTFDGLRDALGDDAAPRLIDVYQPGDTDFRSTIAKIRSSGYEAVGVFLMSGQIAQFYRQLRQQRGEQRTFGTDFFESTTEIKASGGAMDGAVYAHVGVSEAFRRQYTARFGNDLQVAYAGNGYDMACLLAEKFAAATGRESAEQIIEKLESPEPHSGVGGTFRFRNTDEGGAYFEYPVMMKMIQRESFSDVHE